ncbi:hypothetical protein GF314_02555 [bacterium]|nr:hypothetical protein [bacterium]
MRAFLILAVGLVAAGAAAASDFCGGNGIVALSFTEGPEATAITTVEPGEAGLTTVAVHAILDDVTPVDGPGGVVLAIGGFEMALRVTGAEPLSIAKRILVPHRDFGPTPRQIWAGVASDGERIDQGPLPLVAWTVTFTGKVEDVRFDLDPAGLLSCEDLPGCADSGASALYSGAVDVAQEGFLFGAGCMPAVLNPTGEPDLQPVPCTVAVTDVGIFQPRP